MTDFLTRRNGTWHLFVESRPNIRLPTAAASCVIPPALELSMTAMGVARRVAQTLDSELERFWKSLTDGQSSAAGNAYDQARRRARELGFDFVDNSQLITQPLERIAIGIGIDTHERSIRRNSTAGCFALMAKIRKSECSIRAMASSCRLSETAIVEEQKKLFSRKH